MRMTAISIHQPWASLCVTRQPAPPARPCRCNMADDVCPFRGPDGNPQCEPKPGPMVKGFETRSWPCPPTLIGQRIALHATAKRPTRRRIGNYYVEAWFDEVSHAVECDCDGVEVGVACQRRSSWRPVMSSYGHNEHDPLPLGAIVGSAIVEACYPITRNGSCPNAPHIAVGRSAADVSDDPPLTLCDGTGHGWTDVSAQLPYGDWTPGRFAWLLADAAPVQERCPWCWGEGFLSPRGYSDPCHVCTNHGACKPIPAKGHQKVWRWHP